MTNSSAFRSKEEELARLVKEIAEIRNNMKEDSAALHRIERHVKRVFEIPQQAKASQVNLKAAEDDGGRASIWEPESSRVR